MIVRQAVSEGSLEQLSKLYDKIFDVTEICGKSTSNLQIIGRPDLHATLTKLHLWNLTEFERVLYLDADTLVLSNLDHLFSLPDSIDFAASPELGFPDCFNSGVMLLKPSSTTFAELQKLAGEIESFDGGDQGLLNVYFGDGTLGHPIKHLLTSSQGGNTTRATSNAGGDRSWYRLSFTYNMEMHKVYRFYIPAVLRYRSEHKVLHFIGKDKPWHFTDGKVDNPADAPAYFNFYVEMVEKWWEVRRQAELGCGVSL